LNEHDLFLKPEKCSFKQNKIKFLGIKVTHDAVHMDDMKLEKVRKWIAPSNITEVQQFLGLTGYYRYFIKDYSCITHPLLDLMIKTTLWHWEEHQQEAFDMLKDLMCSKLVL